MLALRRISIINRYIHPLSSVQCRYKSRDDKSTNFREELLNFERKNTNTSRNTRQSTTRETLSSNDNPTEDLLRSLNVKNLNRRNKSPEDHDRSSSNLAKSFDIAQKKQKRNVEQKKSRPHVILDTESNEVKTLTRQVADSLTPPNTPNESSNIEQELLDVLRGHRVVSKNTRRMDKKPEFTERQQRYDESERSSTKTRTRPSSDTNVEKTTEAFSSLLRDIKLQPTRGTSRASLEEDFVQDDGSRMRSRSSDTRDNLDTRKPMRDTRRRQEFMKPQRLWSGEPLGIFNSKDIQNLSSKISPMWEKYEEDELTRISSIPPRNAFEEMIQWTKDGILWKFPIDNEQDIGPEADVPFYEHVLLERHIQDFPNSPLIRQFMELVCIGLGRNPYWTVEQKLEHINWFRTFFNEKMHVFNETVHTGVVKTSAPSAAAKPVSTYKPKATPPPAPPKVVPVVPPAAVKAPAAASKK